MSTNAAPLGERKHVLARVTLLQATVMVVLALGALIVYGPASWLV